MSQHSRQTDQNLLHFEKAQPVALVVFHLIAFVDIRNKPSTISVPVIPLAVRTPSNTPQLFFLHTSSNHRLTSIRHRHPSTLFYPNYSQLTL